MADCEEDAFNPSLKKESLELGQESALEDSTPVTMETDAEATPGAAAEISVPMRRERSVDSNETCKRQRTNTKNLESDARQQRMEKTIKHLRFMVDYMRRANDDLAIKTDGLAANLRHYEHSLQEKDGALADAVGNLRNKEVVIERIQAEGGRLWDEHRAVQKQLDEAREKGVGLATELEAALKKLEAMEISETQEKCAPTDVRTSRTLPILKQGLQECTDELKIELSRSKEERDRAREDLANLTENNALLHEKINSLMTENLELMNEQQAFAEDMITARKEQERLYEDLKKQLDDLKLAHEAECQRMEALNAEMSSKLQKAESEGRENAKNYESVTGGLQAQIADLESQKAAIAKESGLLHVATEEQKTLIESLRTETQELSTQISALRSSATALQDAADAQKSEFELLNEENRELIVQVSDLQNEVTRVEGEYATLHRHRDDLQSQIAREQTAKEKEITELSEAKSRLESMSEELREQVEQSASRQQAHLRQVSELVSALGPRIDSYRSPNSPSTDEEKIEDCFRVLRLFVGNLQPTGPLLGKQPMLLDSPIPKDLVSGDIQPTLVLADAPLAHNLSDDMDTDEPSRKQDATTPGSSEKAQGKRPAKENGEERVENLKRGMKAALARSRSALKKR